MLSPIEDPSGRCPIPKREKVSPLHRKSFSLYFLLAVGSGCPHPEPKNGGVIPPKMGRHNHNYLSLLAEVKKRIIHEGGNQKISRKIL
jgi:hypothetical protein